MGFSVIESLDITFHSYDLMVPWLAATVNSSNTLIAQVTGTASGHDVVQFWSGGGQDEG